VNERRIRHEIERGASTVNEVAPRGLAGSVCHGGHPTIEAILAEHAGNGSDNGRRGHGRAPDA
jgi:hypothetical protein